MSCRRARCADRARDRPAERRQARLDRDLLHRRTAVPRIPEPLSADAAGTDTRRSRARLSASTSASRSTRWASARASASAARRGAAEAPWFVARKDMASNTLWVVQGHDHPWLMSDRVSVHDAVWISGRAPPEGTRLAAKTRYRQQDASCRMERVQRRLLRAGVRRPAVGGDTWPIRRRLPRRG